jgi:glycerophosphoryl diester phosphodiesterase
MLDPDAEAGLRVATDRGHDAVHPHWATVTATLVERAHAAGLQVNVWTVDDPDLLRTLAGMGVDAIVTNTPAKARAALADPA